MGQKDTVSDVYALDDSATKTDSSGEFALLNGDYRF
jgi:hypothetical protein